VISGFQYSGRFLGRSRRDLKDRDFRSHTMVERKQSRLDQEVTMKAQDVMVRDVVTVGPDTKVAEAVALLTKHDVSALPVVDTDGTLIGILSEADLLEREELGAEHHHPWWIESLMPASKLAEEFAKAHGKKVSEVMSTNVIIASEDTPASEIAALLERHRIKRVPIVRDDKVVGIVSRSNLIQALASSKPVEPRSETDHSIRLELLDRLGKQQKWTDFGSRNIIVQDGVVHLWGLISSKSERKALIALAEGVPGVVSVSDEMIPTYSS
jgi:CBS domain-containing protein